MITQLRLAPAKFPAGITSIILIKCARNDCRITSGCHGNCFRLRNECFRHISLQSVIIAVAELVTLITPLPIRNFSRQVTPIVYLTAPLYVALLVRLSRVFSELCAKPVCCDLARKSLLIYRTSALSCRFKLR